MRLFEIQQPIYKFKDGLFRFHTATYGSWANDVRIVFRVRLDSNPTKRAAEKDIKNYDRIIQSSEQEINLWLEGHPKDKLLKVIMD